MKPTKDARYLINSKRLKRPTNIVKKAPRGIIDARSILNSKQKLKSGFGTSSSAGFSSQRSFTSKKKPVTSRVAAQNKYVKVAKNGNIVITAKSKDNRVADRTVPRWTLSDVDTADVEALGINDVMDIDALPSASFMPTGSRSAEDTMVADQVTTPQTVLCISNLHPSVSKQDIFELFGDIGLVKHAEMVRPGAAIVEYFDSSDALQACELYHQRLLDGQPMVCQVQPRSQKRSLISQRLGERIDSARPLNATSRSIHNPRNVRFTVKLT